MQKIGFRLEEVGKPDVIHQLTREQVANSCVILDTDEDVAWLVQLVNDFHRSPFYVGGTAPIVCMVSELTFNANRRLGAWLIGGSAAVFSVLMREWDRYPDLRGLYRSLTAEPTSEPDG